MIGLHPCRSKEMEGSLNAYHSCLQGQGLNFVVRRRDVPEASTLDGTLFVSSGEPAVGW